MSAPPNVLPIAIVPAQEESSEPKGQPTSTTTGLPKPKPTLSQMLRDHTEAADKQRKATGTSVIYPFISCRTSIIVLVAL